MANNKYEYVKCFEAENEVMYSNIIVVQIDGRDFGSFSEKHGFEKPNDEKALNLMNACAIKFRFEEGNHILPEASKGTQTQEKMNCLPNLALITMCYQLCFGWGPLFSGTDEPTGNAGVVVEHCNIIEMSFWKEYPRMLDEEEPLLTILRPHSNKMLRLS